MGVEIDIVYEGGLHCMATHGPSKQTLPTDAPVDNGGKGEAFSPTDLVATALGTCLVTIMGLRAKERGLNIEGTRIHVVKEMAADPLRRIASLTVTITLPEGAALSDGDREQLESVAMVCPVTQSLGPDVDIRIEFVYPE